MGATILKLDRYRKLLNADVTLSYPVNLKSVEPVQKHVNKCEQRVIPELNGIILLKLHHEWHTTISVWASRNLTRGRWFKMAQKLMLKMNYNPRQSRERRCDTRAFQFSPSRLRICVDSKLGILIGITHHMYYFWHQNDTPRGFIYSNPEAISQLYSFFH